MDIINITINGVQLKAKKGQTILEAARDNGIFIPTLCHDDRLKPFGSCLLCRVEVEGARGNMLSCGTKVTEGMIIRTETDSVNDARKMCLELLVSQHYGDCKAPCAMACPAEIDIQGYIAHIANGEYQEAVKLIKEKNPLPLVCGRVCTRPCEDECRRNLVDERVGIDYLKRFVSDYDSNSTNPYIPRRKEDSGKKAAVIGAGPSGLSCAYYLALEGHEVTIFERLPKGGGMLRYGIPEYRLPKDVLDKEIDIIKKLGVKIEYNKTFGKDITFENLKKEGYEALFLGVGSQIGQPMGCEGENCTPGICSGVDFLGRVGLEEEIDLLGKKVIVVGGGNTAVDAARSALRLGADEVKIAYRRTKSEMPAHEMEIEEAEYEGVELDLLIAPNKMWLKDGKVALEFIKMELGEPDASGRRKPVAVKGSEYTELSDLVIAAIGQTQDLSFVNDRFNLEIEKSRIKVDSDLYITNLKGVFAGGDVVTGPQTAIKAIAAGRTAAYSMDLYLKGEELKKPKKLYNHTKGKLNEIDKSEFEGYEKLQKEKMPMLSKEQRVRNFKEVELGFSEEQAKKEAKRCLSCGCKDVNECKLRDFATIYDVKQDRLRGEITKHPIDESHPYISRDKNKCIMCGRCVRICLELQGAGAIGFVSRGYNTTVEPSYGQAFGEESRCEQCGQCISTCPVGALTEKVSLKKPGPFVEDLNNTICNYCGIGCSIKVHTTGRKYVRTTAEVGVGVNNGNLCVKGKFGNSFISSKERLISPMIRKDGKLIECSFEEAFKTIGERLNQIKGQKDDIGVYVSQRLTNEECYLIQKLARDGLNTSMVTSFDGSDAAFGLKSALGVPSGTAVYDDIKSADLIVVLGFDIKEENPVAALMVKDAVENGAELLYIHNEKSKLQKFASEVISVSGNELVELLKNCYQAINSDIDTGETLSLMQKLKNSKKPLFIIGGKINKECTSIVANIAKAIGKVEGNILPLHGKCNTQGALDIEAAMCMNFNTLPIDKNFEKASDAVLIFGEDPIGCNDESVSKILKENSLLVVCDVLYTKTMDIADVVLPLVSFVETSGTFTNSERRIQKIKKCIEPLTGVENYEIILGIATAIGLDWKYENVDEISEEIKKLIPMYGNATIR